MPVLTKLDPLALPEKGRYVERPLLFAVSDSTLIALAGKINETSSNNVRPDAVVCLLPECMHESILESWKSYKRALGSGIDTPQKQQSSAQGTRKYLLR